LVIHVESLVLRQLIAVFVTSALMLGSMGAGATSAASSQPQNHPPIARNQPALTPAPAAGIREAQGASDRGVLIASGLILAGIVAALLLIDDDENTVSTGTTASN